MENDISENFMIYDRIFIKTIFMLIIKRFQNLEKM